MLEHAVVVVSDVSVFDVVAVVVVVSDDKDWIDVEELVDAETSVWVVVSVS